MLDPKRKPFATLPFGSSRRAGASSPDVRAIHEDGDGTLWVGTFGDGLYAIDEEMESVRNYRRDPSGLSDDVILSIAEGSGGRLWVGASRGLNHFDPRTGRS
ncbi:MAG: two-component regulator propeller domain-containing protein, partial [Vicinamibacteria bacterium]